MPRDMAATFARLYGVDVSAVPIHRGRAASERAAQMSARAFTEGGAVFLPAEAGDIDNSRVRGLLAHELTHAVQQRKHGPTLPSENDPSGLAMEMDAIDAERYFRGDPGAPEPAPAACDHPDAKDLGLQSVSWTPDGGMVSGVQRASESEITEQYFAELNEVRAEMGKSGRLNSPSELNTEERIALELRLRKAGTEDLDDTARKSTKEEARPVDGAELFAQIASTLSSDLLRPFYSRSAKEQEANRDAWREAAVTRGSGRGNADRTLLDDEEEGVEDTAVRASGPGASEPSRTAYDHPDAEDLDLQPVSWTPDGGMVSGAHQASAGEVTQRPPSEPNTEEPIALEPRLPMAGTAHQEDAEKEPKIGGGTPGFNHPRGDEKALRALYPLLVSLLEQDGLLPTGSTTKVGAAAGSGAGGHAGPAALAPTPSRSGPKPPSEKRTGSKPGTGQNPGRPVDTAELVAQVASNLSSDLLRPFYSRTESEVATSRDQWRALWQSRGSRSATAPERALLEEEDRETGPPVRSAVPPSPPAPLGAAAPPAPLAAASPPAPLWAATAHTPLAAASPPAAVAADTPPTAVAADTAHTPLGAASPPAAVAADTAHTPAEVRANPGPTTGGTYSADSSTLVEQWDETSLRVLSVRLYPLLVEGLRRELLTAQQRQGIF
ncbi:DUF4157 domain-containing protein [Streptomyces vinaceus]|uniref:eCIS core domain-containing protein n=1 Tax=Streptomyces vinaceus TaxID=1960 RepID=UPI0035D97F0C